MEPHAHIAEQPSAGEIAVDRLKATLRDANGLSEHEREQAEMRFCEALAMELGGAEHIAPVYLTYLAVAEIPTTQRRDYSQSEREAVVRWIKAETAAGAA